MMMIIIIITVIAMILVIIIIIIVFGISVVPRSVRYRSILLEGVT